ncbi:hypothetical protein Q5Y75_12845 [Ruegeria sp. 2205SS24-7]|uniref:hypothetical protein n=1 Tax=Ruegeria discodermiae TaxID=3064389 RepID=UPI0027405D34|nr:hypothetical protein [Ruegeria sp. 2205SS24-7]MDP5218110.1 hypothetical protein [Ruegeria sp. 2205SS24-7]
MPLTGSDAVITVSRNAQDVGLIYPFDDPARNAQPKSEATWFAPLQKLGLRNKSEPTEPKLSGQATSRAKVDETVAAADPSTTTESAGWLAKLLKRDDAAGTSRFRPFAKLRARDADQQDPATQFTLGGNRSGALLALDGDAGMNYNAFLGADLGSGVTLSNEVARNSEVLNLLETEPQHDWPGKPPSAAYGPASRGHGIDTRKEEPRMAPLGIKLRF